jgi:hypothetical protein
VLADGPPSGADTGSPGTCPKTPCAAEMVCFEGRCVDAGDPCSGDDECQGDRFCHAGRCVAYGPQTKLADPTCARDGFVADAFQAPVVRCNWTGGNAVTTPLVIDLDADKKPEILVVDFDGRLVVIEGASCKQRLVSAGVKLAHCAHLAAADLDGDGTIEIVAVDAQNKVAVLSATGQLLATSAEAGTAVPNSTVICAAIALADLDGQPGAEIVHSGMALRYAAGKLTKLFNVAVPTAGPYGVVLPAIADIDGDGAPEVVTGNRILDGKTGADKTPAAVKAWPAGWVAIADMDKGSAGPEVVLVSSQAQQPSQLRVYHPTTGKVVFGPHSFDQRYGGAPTVADFDGDGEPEIGVAGHSGYFVFDRECAQVPLPSFCQAPGVRWKKATQDHSSSATGSSVFDFNGDGRAEVVYRDECWLRVYDGVDGKTLFAAPVTSGTGTEMPVIADVDGDGHAEIIVSSDDSHDGKCGQTTALGQAHSKRTRGVLVLADPKARWMSSRPIWNQHSYHITNVADDGSVPRPEPASWLGANNYRQNAQGKGEAITPAPDLTAKKHVGVSAASDCVTVWVLLAEVCNRGAADAPAGLSGTFYSGDPNAGGVALCTATTQKTIAPGACETVECDYKDPAKGAIDLWFIADSGDGALECKEQNNMLEVPQVACPGVDIE